MQSTIENNKSKKVLSVIDWPLLLFIILAVNVKIYVKVAAVAIYLVYLLFIKKVPRERKLPGFVKFYITIIIAGVISSLCSGAFSDSRYLFGFGWGILQWLCAAGIAYATFLSIRSMSLERMEKTIAAFFVGNALFCLANVLYISIQLGHFPYWFPDPAGQYGVSAGDHIQSIFQSNSITNAAVSMLGSLYYISNKRFWLAVMCMATGLLSTSNVTMLLFIVMLIALFFSTKEKQMKKSVFFLLLSTGITYAILSPANFMYMSTVAGELKIPEVKEKKGKGKKVYTINLKDSIYTNVPGALSVLKNTPSQIPGVAFDTNTARSLLNTWYDRPLKKTPVYNYKKPLKLYATKQTISFLFTGWRHFLVGAGMGNYSSKLAVKMTGLGFEGSYPEKYVYANIDFLQHTFHSIMYVYSMHVAQHSIINTPRNIYNQIAGEYGLLGILLFVLLYIGYLYKNKKKLKYGGIIIVVFTFLLFGFDYWFEYMSLTVIFELLMMKQIEYADS